MRAQVQHESAVQVDQRRGMLKKATNVNATKAMENDNGEMLSMWMPRGLGGGREGRWVQRLEIKKG